MKDQKIEVGSIVSLKSGFPHEGFTFFVMNMDGTICDLYYYNKVAGTFVRFGYFPESLLMLA